jgi:hypothetical protein
MLPIIGVIGVLLSLSRNVFQESYLAEFLITILLLDLLLFISKPKLILNKIVVFFLMLLLGSVIIGLINENQINRRYLTDILFPLLFIYKTIFFRNFWNSNDFVDYVIRYSKITFWSSLILIPIIYILHSGMEINRISIFPPLEIAFSLYLVFNSTSFAVATLFLILFYGKRAQFVGAVTVLMFSYFFRRSKNTKSLKYFTTIIVVLVMAVLTFYLIPDNIAVKRLGQTLQNLISSDDVIINISEISSARDTEIETLTSLMSTKDYLFGKGVGFVYELEGYDTNVSNSHFTPLGLLSKYGIVFTVGLYLFIFFIMSKYKKETGDSIAFLSIVFILSQSFFSYSLFVTPIMPVCLGYLYRKER